MNIVIALLLAVHVSVSGSACDLTQREVVPALYDLLRVSHSASKDAERAMFLVRGEDGRIDYELWPATNQRRKATFRGAVPKNAIAIAHTHPHAMPLPSQHDLEESERTGLPIYVVTRTAIYLVNPDRSTTEVVSRTDWAGRLEQSGGDACVALA